jgi:hypothetical protein
MRTSPQGHPKTVNTDSSLAPAGGKAGGVYGSSVRGFDFALDQVKQVFKVFKRLF